MKITSVCCNQIKRKRVQILLAIFFLLAFTTCFYITIQIPRKTVVYVGDVHRFPTAITKTGFLESNAGGALIFEENEKAKTSFNDVDEIFRKVVGEITGQTLKSSEGEIAPNDDSVLNQEENMSINKKVTTEKSSFFSPHEEKFESQADSLQGFLNHHIWEQLCNHQVESLREFILFPQSPSKRRSLLTSSSIPGENGNNFGERVFGFISPLTSGEYQFAISSSGNSELWLSSDESSEKLRKIASLGSRDNPGRGEPGRFSKFASQISTSFFLNKSVRYFVDIIHKHQSGKAHLDVAWRLPGEDQFLVITSESLRAKMNDSLVPDNAVRLADYEEQPQQSRDIIPRYVYSEEVENALPICSYHPSYLVKHQLIRFQGARNKSNTHFAAVYPPDTTNNSLPLLKSEAIWWRENALGNSVTNKDEAEKVVRSFMEALETTFPQLYALQNIVSVEHVPDPRKGDRFLLELQLIDNRTRESAILSEYVYRRFGDNTLCYPEGFHWKKQATVNIIVPVRNAGRWAFYFIRNIAEITRQTQDLNIHVIIIDYESSDIDTEAVLEKSSIQRYTVVRIPGEESFQRAVALQRGAEAVTDPHSILFLCDLHLKIPSKLISTIRKHCIEGKMAFAPVVKRLRCGYYPGLPFGYWETLGFGLLAIFKSDFDRVGGMNTREFTGWGGEDWELLDRILMSGLEVERLKIPDFYHFYHPSFGGSNQRVGA